MGETALFAGPRIAKDQKRMVVCGDIDELTSVLGVARSEDLLSKHADIIRRIQGELIEFCAEIVCLSPVQCSVRKIDKEYVQRFEREIDEIETFLEPMQEFIIPGHNKTSAYLHFARTVCRRAERHLVVLCRSEPDVSEQLLCYLNRLSDLLFVMARKEEDRPKI